MNQKTNRKEKIKLINAVRDGLLMPGDLRPAKIHTFFEKKTENGTLWEESFRDEIKQILNDSELQEFLNKLTESNDRRLKFGLEIDRIIRVVYR